MNYKRYIKTQRDDLRIRDFRLYKTTIFALCQGIGKKIWYSLSFNLSYDMVFFSISTENFETEMTLYLFKCPTTIQKNKHEYF